MPVEVIESPDSITAIVEFRTSPVYEMIVSLHTLVAGRRHQHWAEAAKAALGAGFLAELDALYKPFKEGAELFEYPVDYEDHEDVLGYIQYVREMDPATFTFYFIGRVVSIEELRRVNLDPDRIAQYITTYCEMRAHPVYPYVAELRETLTDISGYQTRLVDLWETYWKRFFHSQIDALAGHWSQAIAEKQNLLDRSGGRALLELVTGSPNLPHNLPEDQAVREVTFVPLYYVTAPSYRFFGYGNVTVLFDCERTQARVSELEQRKDQALAVARTLGDNTRLKILKLIAQKDSHGWHGKRIAERLDLSPSAVSRQLTQLRDSGLLIEERHDDQTVTYKLVKEAITSLPDKILDYLFG